MEERTTANTLVHRPPVDAAAGEPPPGGVGNRPVDQVLERLERIDELRRSTTAVGEAGGLLLDELRALVGEAEAWARAEGDGRARAAAEKLRAKAEGMR